MFDMLGRAKWDAWERQRGYTTQDAKQLYVESMLKVLRRFEDRPLAISLMAELEAYSGDVAEQVMSGTLAETASVVSSSVDHSPSQRAYGSMVQDDNETDDDEHPELLHKQLQEAHDARHRVLSSSNGTNTTQTNSGSHETVTVSDMPQDVSAWGKAQAPHASTRRPGVLSQPPAPPRPSARPRRSAVRAEDSVIGSERGGTPSFTSAQETRSVHNGPMGRYTPSASGRSSVKGGVPPTSRSAAAYKSTSSAPRGLRAQSAELDQTLRAMQASLTTLTERLERTESTLARRESKSLPRLFLHHTMAASYATLQDIGAFLGLVMRPDDTPTPSYEAWRAHGLRSSKPYSLWPLIRSPFQFAALVVGLVLRILLDLSSLFVVASLLVAALRQISGRGDPWIALRLLGRMNTRLTFLANAANRRAFVRALLASVVLGGVTLESTRNLTH